jgi:chromosome segregation ATPase
MTIQELIEKLNAAVDGAIVLAEQWYNGAAPVSNRDNNDNWCNLMDARRHLADLADRIAELIRKYNALCLENTPLRMELEILNNSLDQTLAEIANLREQVRVRDEAKEE